MKRAVAATVAGLLAAGPATAGTQPAAAPCPDVLDYLTWKQTPDQSWDFRKGELVMIGAVHSRDPAHEQFVRIAAEFARARPTVLFFEGPDRGTGSGREETIRTTGESGFARLLASEAGIPARSLEPSPAGQIRALTEQYSFDKVLLFFVVREASRLRDRERLSGARLDSAVAALLGKVKALAERTQMVLPFSDLAGLDVAFRRYWPDRDWRTAGSGWFDPLADDRATGGRFMAAINRADSGNRNRHLVKLLAEAVAAGERPFVVVGRNHVPMIAPALDCALDGLGKPKAD